MSKSRLLVLLSGLVLGLTFAGDKVGADKAIYKWHGQDGLIHYSHIKPNNSIGEVEQLDSSGRKVKAHTDDFGQIKTIPRPDKVEQTGDKKTEEEVKLAEKRQEEIKQENCKTLQENLRIIETGEVYENDAKGNKVLLKPEQLKAARAKTLRDMDYFCSPEPLSKK